MTTARVGVADPRFLLPSFPSTVTALEPAWARALEVLGVEQADRPDLVVCGPSEVEAALAIDPPAVIVEGGSRAARRALERAGHRTSTWMALGAATTEALIPLHAPRVARHAIARWRPPASRLRRTVGLAAVTAGIELPGRRTVLVGSRDRRPPAVVRAAVDAAGLRATSEMFLGVPGVEVTSRLAAMIFDEGATEPAVVVKFLRRANAPATAFDEDERGLALAARFPVVASRAPSLLARLDIAGHPASVETAALGTPMGRSLASGSAGARHAIDAVAAWLVEVGSATASGTAETAWRALARDAVPAFGLDAAVVDVAREVPGVLAHRDLGTWNVIAGTEGFTVLDWESAALGELPLSDLAYFLADAFALLHGARTVEERTAAMVDTFAGRSPYSAALFDWLDRGARAVGLRPDVARRLVPLAWLSHGVPPRGPAGERRSPKWPAELLCRRWLDDPALGLDWRAWEAR